MIERNVKYAYVINVIMQLLYPEIEWYNVSNKSCWKISLYEFLSEITSGLQLNYDVGLLEYLVYIDRLTNPNITTTIILHNFYC